MLAVFKIALRALRRNVLRSFLTMLGIIVGIAAVIVGVSMGTGAKAEVDKRIASMGQNLLTVLSGNMNRGGVRGGFGMQPNLTIADYEAIRKEVLGVTAASPEARVGGAQIVAGNQNTPVQVSGVSAEYLTARSWVLRGGDNFSETDVRNANKVCLIGSTTATSLFGENVDPVGQIIRIKNAPFTIVGFFAGSSLVVGGIGIMNIMLVSVTERTREIGIRLAVGARGRDVLRQFLTEAVLLSVVGGALGIGTGFWLAPLLTKFAGFPTLISNASVIMAFTVSAIIGIVFGFFPALKAARLDPIDALRYE